MYTRQEVPRSKSRCSFEKPRNTSIGTKPASTQYACSVNGVVDASYVVSEISRTTHHDHGCVRILNGILLECLALVVAFTCGAMVSAYWLPTCSPAGS